MVNCKNCKHWEPNTWDEIRSEWLGMHECLRIRHENQNPQEHDIVEIDVDYGYEARIKSKGVFGCALGEQHQ